MLQALLLFFTTFLLHISYFCGVILMTLTAISMDRLLAVLLGLRYRQVITLWRVLVFAVAIWLLNIANAVISHCIPLYALSFSSAVVTVCIIVSASCYLTHTSPPPNSSTTPCSPRTSERRKNSPEYSTVQKNSVQYDMGADIISGLLSSLWCNRRFS